MAARHPGNSFPVHHHWEAVPTLTNDNLSPPYLGPQKWVDQDREGERLPILVHPFSWPKQGSGWQQEFPMCTRVLMFIHNDIFTKGLSSYV